MERVAGDGSPSRLVSFINAVLEEAASPAAAASATLLDGHRGARCRGRGGTLSSESANTPGTGHSGATSYTKVGNTELIFFFFFSRESLLRSRASKSRRARSNIFEIPNRKILNETFVSALCLAYILLYL